MIARLLIVFGLGLAAIVALVLFLDEEGERRAAETRGALAWSREPALYGLPALPRDRVAIGRVENAGTEAIGADAEDFTVRDARDRELAATFQFIDAGAQRIPPSGEARLGGERNENGGALRLGTRLELEPGRTSPLTVSYRLPRRVQSPISIYFGDAPALELPEGPLRRDPPAG